MRIVNCTRESVLAENYEIADNFIKRFLGLMGKEELPSKGGLLIVPCNSIHMFFMKIPLDVVFINRSNKIVYLLENIKPWQVSRLVREACAVIELPAGTIAATGTMVGDMLEYR